MSNLEIKQIFRAIPHASKVDPLDFREWLQTTLERDPKRILWHLKRQAAVGGSEIGTLLLEAQGLTPPFARTGATLAAEKLFKIPPTSPLPHMLRGILLEKAVIQAMHTIYGGQRDFEAEAAFKNQSNTKTPALAGNPDLYWMLNDKRILTDIKVPMSSTELEEQGSDNHKLFTYKSQLHQYDLIGQEKGIIADQMVIAELDVPVELADAWTQMIKTGGQSGYLTVVDQMTALLATEKPGMRINFIEVEPEMEVNIYGTKMGIKEAITTVGTQFMQGLVNGDMNITAEDSSIPLTETQQHEISDFDYQLGILRSISEYAEAESAGLIESYKQYASDHHLQEGKLSTSFFNATVTKSLDVSSAVATLKRYPIDTDSLRKAPLSEGQVSSRDLDISKTIALLEKNNLLKECLKKPGYDTEKVIKALNAVGENPSTFTKEDLQLRKGTSKSVKAQFADIKEHVRGIEEIIHANHLQDRLRNDHVETPETERPPAKAVGFGPGH
ncbi:hypothetical protein [uncultured Amphritea sp.]|uniref:hypothetical protein n=1 Tax=uncultured Amphritea sp. TaxID=981605 RepID=UPI00261BE3EF|nr:hypothetical protein [uncultured Amphritea sp.]